MQCRGCSHSPPWPWCSQSLFCLSQGCSLHVPAAIFWGLFCSGHRGRFSVQRLSWNAKELMSWKLPSSRWLLRTNLAALQSWAVGQYWAMSFVILGSIQPRAGQFPHHILYNFAMSTCIWLALRFCSWPWWKAFSQHSQLPFLSPTQDPKLVSQKDVCGHPA